MLTIDVIRAWKDEDYRRSLSAEQLAQLPAHPSGDIEVRQSDRDIFEGGRRTMGGGGAGHSKGICCS
jgi:mersacidin/lichenicidin family type 2 lantibiotic